MQSQQPHVDSMDLPLDTTLDAGLMVDEHLLMIVYSLFGPRVALHTPEFLLMWYLSEKCAYQTTCDRRMSADPLSCEEIFGRHTMI